jgi:predicted Zn-dependent protease
MTKQDAAAAFSRAIELREVGQLEESISILEKLKTHREDSGSLHAALAYTYALASRPGDAITSFQDAVRAAPRWLPASRGLFHALWDDGQEKVALQELARFQAEAHSEDYVEIISELFVKRAVAEENLALLDQLYQKICRPVS